MRRFLIARTVQAAIVIVLAATVVFVLVHLAPGDPFSAALDDPSFSAETRDRLRAQYGYDQPVATQYGLWLRNIARGDLGISHNAARPVAAVMADAIPNTLLLMGTALVFGLLGGIALGAWQAARRESRAARFSNAAALTLLSVPEFLLAFAAVAVLAGRWRLFPIGGMVDFAQHDSMSFVGRGLDIMRHLTLPALTLALVVAAAVSRYQRTEMLAVLPEDFVRTARAKGAGEGRVVIRHALRNALGPIIQIAGLLLPALVGGAVFIEKIFGWPGMGLTMVDAVLGRDYALVLGGVLCTSTLVVLGGLLADLVAAFADPRVGRTA